MAHFVKDVNEDKLSFSTLISTMHKSIRRGTPELLTYALEGCHGIAQRAIQERNTTSVTSMLMNRLSTALVEDVSHSEHATIVVCFKLIQTCKLAMAQRDYALAWNDLNSIMALMLPAFKGRTSSWIKAVYLNEVEAMDDRASQLIMSDDMPEEVSEDILNPEKIAAYWKEDNLKNCPLCAPIRDHFQSRLWRTGKSKTNPDVRMTEWKEAHCAYQMSRYWHAHESLLRKDLSNKRGTVLTEEEDFCPKEGKFPAYIFDKHTNSPWANRSMTFFVTEGALVNHMDPLLTDSPWYMEAKQIYESKKDPIRKRPATMTSVPTVKKSKGKGHSNDDKWLESRPLPLFSMKGTASTVKDPVLMLTRHVSNKKPVIACFRNFAQKKKTSNILKELTDTEVFQFKKNGTIDAVEMDLFKSVFGMTPLNTNVEKFDLGIYRTGPCTQCPGEKKCSLWTEDNVAIDEKERYYLKMDNIPVPSDYKPMCQDRTWVGVSLRTMEKMDKTLTTLKMVEDYMLISIYHFLFNSTDVNDNNMLVTKDANQDLRLVSMDEGLIDKHSGIWFTPLSKTMVLAAEMAQGQDDVSIYDKIKRHVFDIAHQHLEEMHEKLLESTMTVVERQLERFYLDASDPHSLDARRW